MPIHRSAIFLKVHFLKGLEDMCLQTPVVHVRKWLRHYVTSVIDAILSVISGYKIKGQLQWKITCAFCWLDMLI